MAIELQGVRALLQVFDMPTAVRFYRDVLGFAVVETSSQGPDFDWALLRHGKAELMLNTLYDEGERPIEPEALRAAAHGDTCLYFGCRDVDTAYAHLRAHGVAVDPPTVAHYGMKQLYCRDPDGYALCFQCPAKEQPHG